MRTLRLTSVLLAAVVLWTLAACSRDDGAEADSEQRVAVHFLISLGSDDGSDMPATEGGGTTRADNPNDTWGTQSHEEEEDEGNPFDNYTDSTTLQVRFYNTDNTLLCQLQTARLTLTKNRNEYDYVGYVPQSAVTNGMTVKVVVLLNMPQRESGNEPFTALDNRQFTFITTDAGGTPVHADRIPMVGVCTQPLNLVPNDRASITVNQLQKVFVLRAVSKVRVRLGADAYDNKGFRLAGAELTRGNARGWCLGVGMTTANKTTNLLTAGCKRILDSPVTAIPHDADASASEKENVAEKKKGGRRNVVIYTCEYDNTSATAVPTTVSVLVESKDGTRRWFREAIAFQDYDSDHRPVAGTDYDIIRNHEYLFTVESIADEGLRISATVADMENGGDYYYEYE